MKGILKLRMNWGKIVGKWGIIWIIKSKNQFIDFVIEGRKWTIDQSNVNSKFGEIERFMLLSFNLAKRENYYSSMQLDADEYHQTFVNSKDHYANMMASDITMVGIAIGFDGTWLYIVELFG